MMASLTTKYQRLAALRLSPALVERGIAAARDRLSGTVRVMASLNPDNVLKRGYARVTGASGRTLTTAEAARGEAALGLHFADGIVSVVPVSDSAPPPRPAAKPVQPKANPDQPKLL